MADDDFNKLDDDFSEFDLDEQQGSDQNQPSYNQGPNRSGLVSIIRNVLILLVLAGGGYYAYTMFVKHSSSEPTTKPVTPPATPAETPPHDTAVDFNSPLPPVNTENKIDNAITQTKTFEQVQKDIQASTASKPQPISPEVNAILDSISEEMTLNVNQIKNLEGTINSLSAAVDQLNKSISAMDNRVLSLTETVDSLSQELNHVKKVIVDEDLDLTQPGNMRLNNKKQVAPMASNGPTYTIHAIIPGRAWLRNANGQIITVTEGDNLGDYGKVAVIDASNGLVRTSSGITIK